MKKIVFGILAACAILFTACDNDDNYSLNDAWVGFGIVQSTDDVFQIVLDNKDILSPIASNYAPGWAKHYPNGSRVLLNYTILDEELNTDGTVKRYYIKVNEIADILKKGIMDLTPENTDSIGNDPIVVQQYWITDSLLNFQLRYLGYNKTHFLNLVKEPGELTADDQPIQLTLKHNANNDDEAVAYNAWVSFSLNDLRIEGLDSVRFELSSTDYDGVTHSKELVFNYSDFE